MARYYRTSIDRHAHDPRSALSEAGARRTERARADREKNRRRREAEAAARVKAFQRAKR